MKDKIAQLIKYGFWGVVSTGINLLLFFIFIKIGMQYIVANVVSYILSVIASYIFNNRFVFSRNTSKEGVKQIKYFSMRGVSVAVDSGLLAFLHEICGLNLMASKIIDSMIIILSTYIASKFWVFRNREK